MWTSAPFWRSLVPADQLGAVLAVYNNALDKVFLVAVPLAALGLVCAIPMEWKSVKGQKASAVEG